MTAPQGFPRLAHLDAKAEAKDIAALLEGFRSVLLKKAERLLFPLPWLQGKCEAADLVQETLIQANRSYEQLTGATQEQQLAWLVGILRHRLGDVCRRYSGSKRDVERELAARDSDSLKKMLLDIPADDPTPSSMCRRRETEDELRQAVAKLPADKRAVLLRRACDGWTFEQIAEELGCNVPAARRLLKLALTDLRRLLDSRIV